MADELYNARILALAEGASRHPALATPAASATVDNPLCGDRVTIDVRLDDADGAPIVAAVGQRTRGCLLCQAAAVLIAETAPGQAPQAVTAAARAARAMLKEGARPPAGAWAGLAIFAPVARHKSRHTCVLLPFDAFAKALGEA